MITGNDIKVLFRACNNDNNSQVSPLTALGIPTPPPYFEFLSGSGIISENSAREEVERRVVCDESGDGRWFPGFSRNLNPHFPWIGEERSFRTYQFVYI